MTPGQRQLLGQTVAELRVASVAAPTPQDTKSLSDVLSSAGIAYGLTDLASLQATGLTAAGMNAVRQFAKSFRPEGSRENEMSSTATVSRMLAHAIVRRWSGVTNPLVTTDDEDSIDRLVGEWFSEQARVRTHFVPCVISPYRAPAFSVGPVQFVHIADFPHERFGIGKATFWPDPTDDKPEPRVGGFHFEALLQSASERFASWIALVDVPGRPPADSIVVADLATDIALAALQVVAPGLDVRSIARVTARAIPAWRVDVWAEAGSLSQTSSNNQPARAISPGLLSAVLTKLAPMLETLGERLTAYVNRTGLVPVLDEAWCNAAYWYHEALAESLETVRVAKLETAIEVLFRAVNMSGSKKRIIDSFDAIFGLAAGDPVPGSGFTVEQFALAVTTARSRVVHGTWPTLHTDLPGYKGQEAISCAALDDLARSLLLAVAASIKAYIEAGQTDDSVEALLAWLKANRTP